MGTKKSEHGVLLKVWISEEQSRGLGEAVYARRTSKSAVVREAIHRWLGNAELKRAGYDIIDLTPEKEPAPSPPDPPSLASPSPSPPDQAETMRLCRYCERMVPAEQHRQGPLHDGRCARWRLRSMA